jgi:hypothetical protein
MHSYAWKLKEGKNLAKVCQAENCSTLRIDMDAVLVLFKISDCFANYFLLSSSIDTSPKLHGQRNNQHCSAEPDEKMHWNPGR